MMSCITGRKLFSSLIALGILLGSLTTIGLAQKSAPSANTTGNNSGGTGRQGDGQPLRVMVMKAGAPVANAHIVISVSDGSVILRGLTKANGVFVTNSLDTGVYTVTATKLKATATSPVTIIQSTDPALVSLTLAP
jgi:hypothetical protein